MRLAAKLCSLLKRALSDHEGARIAQVLIHLCLISLVKRVKQPLHCHRLVGDGINDAVHDEFSFGVAGLRRAKRSQAVLELVGHASVVCSEQARLQLEIILGQHRATANTPHLVKGFDRVMVGVIKPHAESVNLVNLEAEAATMNTLPKPLGERRWFHADVEASANEWVFPGPTPNVSAKVVNGLERVGGQRALEVSGEVWRSGLSCCRVHDVGADELGNAFGATVAQGAGRRHRAMNPKLRQFRVIRRACARRNPRLADAVTVVGPMASEFMGGSVKVACKAFGAPR